MNIGTLILFCGKMGAGKSTKSKQLSQERNAILISEDDWLSMLYPKQITSFDDYLHYSTLLKPVIKSHVLQLLKTGVSVVMDFPANTIKQRKWFKELIDEANAPNELIYLNVSDDVCLKQLGKRRLQQPERAIFDTESMFIEVSKYFQPPDQNEGFNLQVVVQNE
ncbi:MAG: ATP-binding protein [Gammaproteobacteria bacterium]|nr:ATP-binding protein [Gammaproteobacteria bacterium]MDH5730860.1 ATP-binding protein [Gammaproteobacteria bacterium]